MIHSMTGYGHAVAEFDRISYSAEVRSVNNRYLKLNIRLPESAGFAEDQIDKLLRKRLGRGMVNFTLKIKSTSVDDIVNIEPEVLAGYVKEIKKASEGAGIDANISISDILQLPGVIVPVEPDEEKARQMLEQILQAANAALDLLEEMRIQEGKALYEDLSVNCSVISEKVEQIEAKMDTVLKEYHERLSKRVDELLSNAELKIDQDLLAREVAIFAERCDISEEISRIRSHLSQFDSACKKDGGAGRKLDFITQELLREANTIASKAGDAEIAANVVDIKCAIDRIKEQVQNIE